MQLTTWLSYWHGRLHSKTARVIISALDPIISSATTFLVQGAVLLSTSKLEFATFSLSYSYVVMGQAVLSALFGGPLVTLLNIPAHVEKRRSLGDAVLRYQLLASLLIAAFGFSASLLLGIDWILAVWGVIGLLGLSFRDALRSVLGAQLRLLESLILAIVFLTVTSIILSSMLIFDGKITAERGLAALATGAILAVLPKILLSLTTREILPRSALRDMFAMATWSLPGVTVIWLQNSFYLTLLAINLNLSAVAEVSAARMVILPILITASGLLRLVQVQASHQLAQNGIDAALAGSRRGALLCLFVGLGLAGICFVANKAIGESWLPTGHSHILLLAGGWLLFAAATTARGIYSALYQAMGRYREIFGFNVAILPLVLGGVAISPLAIGLIGAILPMAAGELLLLVLLVWRARAGS